MNNLDSKCQDSLQSFDRVFIHIADSQNFLSLHAVQLATLRRFAGMQLIRFIRRGAERHGSIATSYFSVPQARNLMDLPDAVTSRL